MINIFKRKLNPIAEGFLSEENGHKVYYHRYGNEKGKTILMFHGGPGGSSHAYYASSVDLKKYNVIMFDQRGCGKSEPAGKLENNTTAKTLSDAKRLLDLFNVKKAIIMGGSWGSTLALLFSEKHSKMVEKIVLTDIYLARIKDDVWAFHETANMYPDLHEKMIKNISGYKSSCDIADYYYKLITSKKESDVKKAMDGFGNYEYSIGVLDIDVNKEPNYKKVNGKKVFLHYMKNYFFIKDDQILKNIKSISNKKCLIIHNRLDLACPFKGAWDLHKLMKKSKLIIKPALGHGINFNKDTKKEIAEFLDK